MPFQRQSLAEIVNRCVGDIESRLPGADALLPRAVLTVLAIVLSGAVNGLYGDLDWQARQILPDTAEEEQLDRWAAIWGVARKTPTAATGTVDLTGVAGTDVPEGSVLQRSDGTQFATEADVGIGTGGTSSVTVQAVVAGSAGNTSANAVLTFLTPIAGVQSNASVDANGIGGGDDTETDDDLRARLLTRIQNPPQGGAAEDYIEWAEAQPGVTRAWCQAQWQGPGTVGVLFVMDDRTDVFPLDADVAAVQTALDALRPVTAQVIAVAPTAVPMSPEIHLNVADTPDIRSAVEASLADLVAREAAPGATIYLSHIKQAVGNAVGVVDYTLNEPTANVVVAAGSMSTLGTVSFV